MTQVSGERPVIDRAEPKEGVLTLSRVAMHNAVVEDATAMPEGWSMARVRAIEPNAELLDPDQHFVVADERPATGDLEVMTPTVILSFSGLCLCLVPELGGSSEWWMGEMDAADGSIVCWSTYGKDLGEAIRAL